MHAEYALSSQAVSEFRGPGTSTGTGTPKSILPQVLHTVQLELLGELAFQRAAVADEFFASLGERLLRGERAIGLDAEVEFGEQRMRDLVAGEPDVRILVELVFEEVAEGVVFLVEVEDGAVGDTCDGSG